MTKSAIVPLALLLISVFCVRLVCGAQNTVRDFLTERPIIYEAVWSFSGSPGRFHWLRWQSNDFVYRCSTNLAELTSSELCVPDRDGQCFGRCGDYDWSMDAMRRHVSLREWVRLDPITSNISSNQNPVAWMRRLAIGHFLNLGVTCPPDGMKWDRDSFEFTNMHGRRVSGQLEWEPNSRASGTAVTIEPKDPHDTNGAVWHRNIFSYEGAGFPSGIPSRVTAYWGRGRATNGFLQELRILSLRVTNTPLDRRLFLPEAYLDPTYEVSRMAVAKSNGIMFQVTSNDLVRLRSAAEVIAQHKRNRVRAQLTRPVYYISVGAILLGLLVFLLLSRQGDTHW